MLDATALLLSLLTHSAAAFHAPPNPVSFVAAATAQLPSIAVVDLGAEVSRALRDAAPTPRSPLSPRAR